VKHFDDICASGWDRKEENGNTDFECELFPVKFGRSRAAVNRRSPDASRNLEGFRRSRSVWNAATSAPLSQDDTFLGKNERQVLDIQPPLQDSNL
jgi:hypothetical protein